VLRAADEGGQAARAEGPLLLTAVHTAAPPLLADATRVLFFSGKGGVGKTTVACASAIALADAGRRTLLVSTDPASNLDEVLGVRLSRTPTDVPGVERLQALNLDPVAAARAYRERVVGPFRGLLPADAVASMEEQLSGACAVEIAAFDEFARWLADPAAARDFDHVVFDTAPTGHTLRLLELPAAWTRHLATSDARVSCLGPLAGLADQRELYDAARATLADPTRTTLVLVARPEEAALREAARTQRELSAIGVTNLRLVVNASFRATRPDDPVARALEARGRAALDAMPDALRALPRTELPLRPTQVLGTEALRATFVASPPTPTAAPGAEPSPEVRLGLRHLVDEIAASRHGVVMTMGKGGVGKTRIARSIAEELAGRGFPVHLTTTDPAGQASASPAPGVRVTRIDPKAEVARYVEEVLAAAGALDAHARALLEEDLRSPCTEEVAVFRALARVVADGDDGFVVIDTAPTGHTVLLLDAAGHYHREVVRTSGEAPDAVRRLLPRLRDPRFTHVVLVTLPEATPVHEAAALQEDLRRAGIEPFAWVVNQSLQPLEVRDPILVARRRGETRYLHEVASLSGRVGVVAWRQDTDDASASSAVADRGDAVRPCSLEVQPS